MNGADLASHLKQQSDNRMLKSRIRETVCRNLDDQQGELPGRGGDPIWSNRRVFPSPASNRGPCCCSEPPAGRATPVPGTLDLPRQRKEPVRTGRPGHSTSLTSAQGRKGFRPPLPPRSDPGASSSDRGWFWKVVGLGGKAVDPDVAGTHPTVTEHPLWGPRRGTLLAGTCLPPSRKTHPPAEG